MDYDEEMRVNPFMPYDPQYWTESQLSKHGIQNHIISYKKRHEGKALCECSVCRCQFVASKPVSICPFRAEHEQQIEDFDKTTRRMLE